MRMNYLFITVVAGSAQVGLSGQDEPITPANTWVLALPNPESWWQCRWHGARRMYVLRQWYGFLYKLTAEEATHFRKIFTRAVVAGQGDDWSNMPVGVSGIPANSRLRQQAEKLLKQDPGAFQLILGRLYRFGLERVPR